MVISPLPATNLGGIYLEEAMRYDDRITHVLDKCLMNECVHRVNRADGEKKRQKNDFTISFLPKGKC